MPRPRGHKPGTPSPWLRAPRLCLCAPSALTASTSQHYFCSARIVFSELLLHVLTLSEYVFLLPIILYLIILGCALRLLQSAHPLEFSSAWVSTARPAAPWLVLPPQLRVFACPWAGGYEVGGCLDSKASLLLLRSRVRDCSLFISFLIDSPCPTDFSAFGKSLPLPLFS